jgi:hypothetical protein
VSKAKGQGGDPAPDPEAGAGAPATLLFVDAIENGRARLLLGRDAFEIPAKLLPNGAREGTWVRLSFAAAAAPPSDDGAALRAKLGRADDGGDIEL